MTILDEIVHYKKHLLSNGYYTEKIKHIKKVDVSYKSTLESSLENESTLSIIAEIKSKSPSVKAFKDINLEHQVAEYEHYGANAISILTDEKYFGGSFERLQMLTQLTHLPILCKDFIIDSLQIDLAKQAGASIILLIVNILTDDTLQSLYQYAISQNLEVLVEVHSKEELERAYQIQPKIIGVNNRDLKTFITKVEHTNEILEIKEESYYYISESGITTLDDVKKIVNSGIDGLLVGGALMNSNDISSLLPSLKLNKVK